MEYFILVILTIISCWLFEYFNITDTTKKLVNSYKRQFEIIKDKIISDNDKQSLLMTQIGKQLTLLVKLIFGIIIFIAPFISLFFLQNFKKTLGPEILITFWGLIIPIITVIFYIYFKRLYGKLFKTR